MSGVYIDMEMPTSCADCRFYGGYCYAKGDENKYSKLPCPLIPVPDHGRLIDKDALEQDISESVVFSGRERNAELIGANKIINRLHRAQTIIPGEVDNG